MNYYPFHIGDYASATRHLSWDEDAAYRRLLDVYYTTEKPLPADMRAIYRLVMASTESQRNAVDVVLQEFFESTADGWINKRADAEIDAMREKQQKQRDRANKRWHKPDAESGNAPAMPRHTSGDATASNSDANAMPPTPTPTPTPTPKEKPVGAASRPQQRGSRLSADWSLPTEWAEWALSERPGYPVILEASKFRDYWVAKTGADAAKADWQATWRNWVRNTKLPTQTAGRHTGFDRIDYSEGVTADGRF